MVAENYRMIRERIDAACRACGRAPEEVTLVAVSKTKPEEMIEELRAIGVRDFGENYPQELKRKAQYFAADHKIRWHAIGQLQTNKVKMVVGTACLIHSVNSLHLAEAVNKEAVKQGICAEILLEVNIAEEATKSGLPEAEVMDLARAIRELPGLKVRGLMTIAPPVEAPEENRTYFRQMRKLRDRINAAEIFPEPLTELSMGMTGDFEAAVAEGATLVRVGTAIFGARDYSNKK